MTKTYRFVDCTNQFAEAKDDNGNHWYFLITDVSNSAQQEWASTSPQPEIEPFPDVCPPDPDFTP